MGIIYAGSRALSKLVRNTQVEVSSLLLLTYEQRTFPSYKVFNAVPLLEEQEGRRGLSSTYAVNGARAVILSYKVQSSIKRHLCDGP